MSAPAVPSRLDGLALLREAIGVDLDAHRLARLIARFWTRVERTEGCWLWRGALQSEGYGINRFGPKRLLAHRVTLLLDGQPLDAALEIDHLCRQRRCVRPLHLEQVDHATNVSRGLAAAQEHCKRGHALVFPNLYVSRGHRQCRQCHLLRAEARYARNAQGVSA
jgi:hypothetical protein